MPPNTAATNLSEPSTGGDPVSGGTLSRRRHPNRDRPSRRTILWLCAALIVVGFIAATSVLFVWPASDRLQRVDAILSLNGTNEVARESRAVSLAEEGYARVLLFSQGNYRTTPCPRVSNVVVVCFEPRPARTVGEVAFATNYLRRRGWHSLMIVAGQAQVTRARILMRRCFSGRLVVVPAALRISHLPFEVVYQWGALVKALLVHGEC